MLESISVVYLLLWTSDTWLWCW